MINPFTIHHAFKKTSPFFKYLQKIAVLFLLFLVVHPTHIQAQLNNPRIEVISINDSTILDLFLIGYTSRDFRPQLGFPQEYKSTFGVTGLETWPLFELKNNFGPENRICQAFRKHSEDFTVWIKPASPGEPSWFVLNQDMNIVESIPILADNHGIGMTQEGHILYSEKEQSLQSFPQFGWIDTLTVTGNTKLYNRSTQEDNMLLRFIDQYDTNLVLNENANQGNIQGAFDWTHNNENRVTRNNDFIINDRHLGARVMRGDSLLFWIGVNDSLASENELSVLSKSEPGDYELKLAHNGREVPVEVFSQEENPDSLYLSFFDNGSPQRPYSRVIVYGIDLITRSHGIVFEQSFPYTPFAGSVEFLPAYEGVYLVNIPVVPDNFFSWIQNQQIDSIQNNIGNIGNLLYLMNLTGDTLATFKMADGNIVYQAELFEKSEIFDSWPGVDCTPNGNMFTLAAQGNPDSLLWYDADHTLLSEEASLYVPDGEYYYTFHHGITTGYSPLINTADCLINSIFENPTEISHILTYPNPAHTNLFFDMELSMGIHPKQIMIYNTMGQLVKSSIMTEDFVDVSNLVPGTYVFIISDLKVTSGRGRFIKM